MLNVFLDFLEQSSTSPHIPAMRFWPIPPSPKHHGLIVPYPPIPSSNLDLAFAFKYRWYNTLGGFVCLGGIGFCFGLPTFGTTLQSNEGSESWDARQSSQQCYIWEVHLQCSRHFQTQLFQTVVALVRCFWAFIGMLELVYDRLSWSSPITKISRNARLL